jgi:hypothetical protein
MTWQSVKKLRMPEYCADHESKRPHTRYILSSRSLRMIQAHMANSFFSALCTMMVHYRWGAVQLKYYLGCGLGGRGLAGGVDLAGEFTEGRITKTRTGGEIANVLPDSSITPTVRSC